MTTLLHTTSIKPRVLEILEGNPALSYSVIANEFGVTRERVRQIARENGYPLRRGILKPKKCPVCGKTYYTKKQNCSRTCAYKSKQNRIAINCHQCGKTIERTPGNLRSKSGRYFCNRECFIRWLGENRNNKGHK